jgi:hypothetical protein
MQLKIYSNLLITLLIGASICRADSMDNLYRQYLLTISTGERETRYYTNWVTPVMKDAFIKRAKAGSNSHNRIEQDWHEAALIRLGDKASIEAHIDAFHKDPRHGLMDADSLLPYLIDDLYNGNDQFIDNHTPSVRNQVDAAILQILRRYPTFPPETRKWADERYYANGGAIPGGPPSYWAGEINQELKMWWEHNKDAVLAGDYGRAAWLPSAATEKAIVEADRKCDEEDERSHPGLILWNDTPTTKTPATTGT